MRQAGRWDPEFRAIRAGLGFYEFSQDVDRATAATLCPRRFGVDAIILFYDITTLPVAMGLPFALVADSGPTPDRPIRTLADVDRLNPEPSPSSYWYIRELLGRVKAELGGSLPVIAFAGAAFTVATYCIGTGKDVVATRRFATEQPEVWQKLLDRITGATGLFLNQLVDDGADVYQLFDSWAGLLTVDEYDRWAQPHHEAVFRAASGVPRILFVKDCPHLSRMCAAGAEVVSLGGRHDLAAVRREYPHLVFQGNVSEHVMRSGTPGDVEAETRRALVAGGGHNHILNLSHGMSKEAPVANFEAYVRTAKSYPAASGTSD